MEPIKGFLWLDGSPISWDTYTFHGQPLPRSRFIHTDYPLCIAECAEKIA